MEIEVKLELFQKQNSAAVRWAWVKFARDINLKESVGALNRSSAVGLAQENFTLYHGECDIGQKSSFRTEFGTLGSEALWILAIL